MLHTFGETRRHTFSLLSDPQAAHQVCNLNALGQEGRRQHRADRIRGIQQGEGFILVLHPIIIEALKALSMYQC